jgi:hypothetical protein
MRAGKRPVIDQMIAGTVDVEADTPLEDAEPVHEVIRGYGIKVDGPRDERFHVGDTVMYLGHGHDDTRGRKGEVRWTRHNHLGHLEVRVDFPPAAMIRRNWDVFIGHETKMLAVVVSEPSLIGAAINEVPFSDLTGTTYANGGIAYANGGTLTGIPVLPTGIPALKLPEPPAIRDDVIQEAQSHISGDRAAAYGDINEDFGRIAQMWSAIFGFEVPVEKVALAMVAVKMSRLSQNLDHRDSWVDIVGYAGLGAEVAKVARKDG